MARKPTPRILDPNQVFVGTEPNWINVDPDEIKKDHRTLLIKSLNWYAANSEAKEQLGWLKKSFPDIKAESAITVGPLCRMVQRGFPKELVWDRIEQMVRSLSDNEKIPEKQSKTEKIEGKHLKTEKIIDKIVDDLQAQIDYMVDDVIMKKSINKVFCVQGLNKNQIAAVSEYATKTISEFDGASTRKVGNEAFYGISKRQENAIIGSLRKLLQQLQEAVPAVVRKPRKKKEIPVDRIVRDYTVSDYGSFKTLPASKIHGASMAMVFESKSRRVSLFVAEEGKTLSVKGKSIINFDEAKSTSKILRKPEDQIAGLMTGAKTNIMKKIDAIKAVAGIPKHRATDTTTLLKIW